MEQRGMAYAAQERRRVEDAYVQGLRKLASRGPRDASAELGIFRTPWQNIVGSMESLADSHNTLVQRIEADVERPLKDYQTKSREMQAISTIQGNLSSMAKEVESAQRKVAKLSGSKSSANKVANATSDVEAANQQWQSQAPYVFESLQALDESRVNHLRDVLTQLETHEADQVERSRTTAESCLNSILNIRTEEEISAFVARQTANAPAASESQPSRDRAGSNAAGRGPPSELPATNATPSRRQPDESAGASPYSTASKTGMDNHENWVYSDFANQVVGPPPPARKGFGLRRLGTVLGGRDKGSKLTERPPSPEKRFRPSRNPLRRGPSSNMQQIDSPPQTSSSNMPPQPPQLRNPLVEASNDDTTDRPLRTPQAQREYTEPLPGPVPLPPRGSSIPMTNGVQASRENIAPQDLMPPVQREQSMPTQRDAEGYSVPPNAVDDITRAQQEAAAAGYVLTPCSRYVLLTSSSEADQSQFKLNIRDAPLREEDSAAQQSAFSTVANTLRSQAVTPRKQGTLRGRRDVRNTVFVPSGQSLESAGLGGLNAPTPPSQATITPPLPADGFRGSDAQSVRSAHSLGSTAATVLGRNASSVIAHPEMHQPGLNASIVESVSATFSHGQVTKAVVIGEIALQNNADDPASSSSGEKNVRLENFAVLEKVAPNPTFISQRESAPGEYSVNCAHAPSPTVAFKYQLHLDDSNLGVHAPLSFTPIWKIEPTQASVILSYNLNLSSLASSQGSLSLQNLIIFISIERTKANSCQSKPAGIFSKEKSLIYWKIGDIALWGASDPPQKLLARFSTEGEAEPGTVEARWEISGEQATTAGSGLGISIGSSSKEDKGSSSDPFADEDTTTATSGLWKSAPITRKIISGRYVAS
ncbi:uncharacterized protein KY384_007123 [Bacidia gigantensis]|uniref:uncharacterized protein n=1 Tax=Bacidia gigantensis TaxID=2732470 RepID=UPI001D03D704|nr:uncharacterized protein KY384_007123 [Bacidia gigantensis]KAG8528206.1 hypothetical protein KY384_007123 [Bacidia gigantensis]